MHRRAAARLSALAPVSHLGRVAEAYRDALAAGIVPANLILPAGVEGTQRIVRIALEHIRHFAESRPDTATFCLAHMAEVIANPEFLGHRPGDDPRRVEFVARVGPDRELLMVAVKFLDAQREAWICTVLRVKRRFLTRRLRSGTMQSVSREP